MKTSSFALYVWAGKWGPFSIKTECMECNVVYGMLLKLKEEFYKDMEIQTLPWLDNWPRLFFLHGAWHSPILLHNNKKVYQFSEKKALPEMEILRQLVLEAKA